MSTHTRLPFVTKAGELSPEPQAGQSGGAARYAAVSPRDEQVTRIWFGRMDNRPGLRSLPHHHGEAETGGYVLSGHGRFYYGENFTQYMDIHAGDFFFIPPFLEHVEANMSVTEQLVLLITRTPDNIVENLPDVDDAMFEGYRRA